MFSYRHAFHAGNHADVLKHTALIAILKHMTQKDAALVAIDTHAGAGLYRLDGDYAGTSGEAEDGVIKLFGALVPAKPAKPAIKEIAPAIQDYLDMVAGFNKPGGNLKVYPGSPFVTQRPAPGRGARQAQAVRTASRLTPKTLDCQHRPAESGPPGGRLAREDGFEGLKAFLPPPSRRAMVLIDPSYEIKNDYAKVSACIQDCLKRFATGTYVVWYPVIPRPEAHSLPRRLKTLATQAGKPWVHAQLAIGQREEQAEPGEPERRPGLTASGVFVINPPHTLKAALQAALPQLLEVLGRGRGKGQSVEAGG
jgi:23S rRNA (adenine2030-N6)-methyltransferase